MELKDEAEKLAKYLESLKGFKKMVAKRPVLPASGHMGAVIADAVLQVGHKYEEQVRQRVKNIRARYPKAATVSGFLGVLEQVGAMQLLNWNGKSEQGRVYRIAKFFQEKEIETSDDLFKWLEAEKNRDSLLTPSSGIPKIADKTADYFRVLVSRPDAIAVDRVTRGLMKDAGIDVNKYTYKKQREIAKLAARQMGIRPLDLDQSIYRYGATKKPKRRPTVRSKGTRFPSTISEETKYCIECGAKIPEKAKYCPKCGTRQI